MSSYKLTEHRLPIPSVKPAFPDDVAWNSETSRMYETFKEFFGTAVLTFVTAGAVLSSGTLSVKYDLVELTSARVFAIALANSFVSLYLFPCTN